MENSEQNLGNKQMPQYPKPGDELQKHIETVIPEEEKEDVESANAAPEQAVKKESGTAPTLEKSNKPESRDEITDKSEAENLSSASKTDSTTDFSEAKNPVNNQEVENQSASEAELGAKEQSSEEKPKDASDEVETVSN